MRFIEGHGRGLTRCVLTAFVLAVFAFAAAPASAATPSASIQSVSGGYASIHINGTIDTGDEYTYYWAEYSTDDVNWSDFPGFYAGEFAGSTGSHGVEVDLSNLQGETKYFVRLVAFNGEIRHPSPGPDPSATTLSVDPPTVLSVNDASEISYTSAKFSGKVERPANPDPAFNANCRFEYVSDQQFGEAGFTGAPSVACNVNPISTPEAKEPVEATLTGLASATTYHVRLVASNPGGTSALAANVFTTVFAPPPALALDPVVTLGATTADVTSRVNPEGTPTSAFLEYSANGGLSWSVFPAPACEFCTPEPLLLGEGTSPVDFNGTLRGLEPNTDYLLRLRATNVGGESVSDPPESFRTLSPPPSVQTLDAGGVGVDSARLGARINPRNSPVTYQFQWGIEQGEGDETYENLAPASPEPLAGETNSPHIVSTQLVGLQPETVYHYRVVATNTLTGVVVKGVDRAFTTRAVSPPEGPCPNGGSRIGPSADLPDCRAFESVTPDINGIYSEPGGGSATALDDGNALKFYTQDAPAHAEGSYVNNWVVSERGPAGWASHSLAPPAPEAIESFSAIGTENTVSADFKEYIGYSSRPLGGVRPPGQMNLYLHRADGTWVPISLVGSPYTGGLEQQFLASQNSVRASGDFKHIFFFVPETKQLPEDPTNGRNIYEWVDGKVTLGGVLPGEVLAPNGASLAEGKLPAISYNGRKFLFRAEGVPGLFLRTDGEKTVQVSESQRTTDPDPNAPGGIRTVGITPDGSEVLFTSTSELTNDANTGETEGVRNYRGADLYSYDVGSKKLTDLTVDNNPADSATGANVIEVLGTAKDASYIYFIATGVLAPGANSGENNLYVEHDGAVNFISSAAGMVIEQGGGAQRNYGVSITPDGRHMAFVSPTNLTAYDHADELAVYKFSYGEGLECVSCRPSGEPPTSGSGIRGKAISDDGSRVFFESADSVVAAATSGLTKVYEYESGKVHLLVPGDLAVRALYVTASASGDDVFISTYGELVPGVGSDFHIYDARVNADVGGSPAPECDGEGCLGPATAGPGSAAAGSARFSAPGRVVAPASKSASASKAKLRITAPGAGEVVVSGKGLRTARKRVGRAGTIAVTVSLKVSANRSRLREGSFKTKARVLFKEDSGDTSATEVTLKFQSIAKGGK